MYRCGFIKLLWKIANWSFRLIFISHVIWCQVAWIQAIWNALVTCWFEIFLRVSSEMKNVLIIFDLKEPIAASNVVISNFMLRYWFPKSSRFCHNQIVYCIAQIINISNHYHVFLYLSPRYSKTTAIYFTIRFFAWFFLLLIFQTFLDTLTISLIVTDIPLIAISFNEISIIRLKSNQPKRLRVN